MKGLSLSKIEANRKIKINYIGKTLWWKNILIIPPSSFIFLGLVGVLYFYKLDMLMSYYTIPFVVILFIGALWLKALKRYMLKSKSEMKDAVIACIAQPFEEKDGYVYFVFVTDDKRHNGSYIANFARSTSLEANKASRKDVLALYDDETDTPYYMKAFKRSAVKRKNLKWTEEDFLPIFFVEGKYVFIITSKDLSAFDIN